MRLPMSGEIVFESALSRKDWLDGIRRECAKIPFMTPQLTGGDGDVCLYQVPLAGGMMQSAFFGAFEPCGAGSRLRGRFRMLRGYSLAAAGAALTAMFMSFVIGWGGLADMRAGRPGHPWAAGDAALDAVMPLLTGLGLFAFWRLARWLDSTNQQALAELIAAGGGRRAR